MAFAIKNPILFTALGDETREVIAKSAIAEVANIYECLQAIAAAVASGQKIQPTYSVSSDVALPTDVPKGSVATVVDETGTSVYWFDGVTWVAISPHLPEASTTEIGVVALKDVVTEFELGTFEAFTVNVVPKGSIILWDDPVVPAGWTLCDGQNGTPNLVGRYVKCAASLADAGRSGGSAVARLQDLPLPAHEHRCLTSFIPRHKHEIDELLSVEDLSHSHPVIGQVRLMPAGAHVHEWSNLAPQLAFQGTNTALYSSRLAWSTKPSQPIPDHNHVQPIATNVSAADISHSHPVSIILQETQAGVSVKGSTSFAEQAGSFDIDTNPMYIKLMYIMKL
jgi:hypothetical protein